MPTPENRPQSEDEEEAVVVKKPYSAPTLVELDNSLTENGGTIGSDGGVAAPPAPDRSTKTGVWNAEVSGIGILRAWRCGLCRVPK
jgi:hypothetical protein